jgi:hypothetical protein
MIIVWIKCESVLLICCIIDGKIDYKLEKTVADGQGKKKYPASQCKVCARNKKCSETKYCHV